MSTKSTIAHGDGFHLYNECFDESAVYLQLDEVELEVSRGSVMVAIPVAVWEVIRRYPGADFSLADRGDDDLRREAEAFVDDRLARVAERLSKGLPPGIVGVAGAMTYGPADAPRGEQVDAGFINLRDRRDRQRALRAAVEGLAAAQHRRP